MGTALGQNDPLYPTWDGRREQRSPGHNKICAVSPQEENGSRRFYN